MGSPASGKTYHTQQVVEAIGAICLRSDVERKRLLRFLHFGAVDRPGARDLYTPDATQRTYERFGAAQRASFRPVFPLWSTRPS